MAAAIPRDEILARLHAQTRAGKSILVVGAGNGLMARCAEAGGVDIIVCYSTGYFRLNGLPSLAGQLPLGNANDISLQIGRDWVMPVIKNTPVICGIYAVDPTRSIASMLDAVENAGMSGVINFPSVGRFTGDWRRELEASGFGFDHELRMVSEARRRGLFTMAYAYGEMEAEQMAEAGVDCLIAHVGLTAGGDIGAIYNIGLDEAVERMNTIFSHVRRINKESILLAHGGPISSPEDVEYAISRTEAVGFVAASSFERIPVEEALKSACAAFKNVSVNVGAAGSTAQGPVKSVS